VVSLGIFSLVPPTEPCALRSTQPLKVSTRDFSWGKGVRCLWLTTYHPCSAETSRKSGALIYPEPLGPPRPVAGHLYFYFNDFSGELAVSLCRVFREHYIGHWANLKMEAADSSETFLPIYQYTLRHIPEACNL